MAVSRYRISLLKYEDCPVQMSPEALSTLLKAWRKSHTFQDACTLCHKSLDNAPYVACCQHFYFNQRFQCYPVQSIAVRTPRYRFLLPQLAKKMEQSGVVSEQDFLVFPDPIYWLVKATLVYEKVLKFVRGIPVSQRANVQLPPTKSHDFYKQIQESPLNYGSLESRSCGKATMIRQVAFGKRCELSMRGMIVPDPSLRPNEIRIPEDIIQKFGLRGKWIILNRMPSLQPENFVALHVPRSGPAWTSPCFAIPPEILEAINGDFDGDECNVYLVPNLGSQAECATLLNAESEMGSFVTGLKLAPSQDMLVAYYLYYDDIHFLPYKDRDLRKTFRVIYELYGSRAAFKAFDDMRLFYLEALQKRTCFAITLDEIHALVELASGNDYETFEARARQTKGCLVTQVLAGAKGSFEHLYQMFGTVGQEGVKSSFWEGLKPWEAVAHARTSYGALAQTSQIWQPGYGYTKVAYNLHNLIVNYLGQLVDGEKRILERDALDALHHTDAMSEETFDFFISEVLVGGSTEFSE